MVNMSKLKGVLLVVVLLLAIAIGGLVGQYIRIVELEEELEDTQEQLFVAHDQLRLIDARNEADKAIKQKEGEDE